MPGQGAHDRERNRHPLLRLPPQHHPAGGGLRLSQREVPHHGVCPGKLTKKLLKMQMSGYLDFTVLLPDLLSLELKDDLPFTHLND